MFSPLLCTTFNDSYKNGTQPISYLTHNTLIVSLRGRVEHVDENQAEGDQEDNPGRYHILNTRHSMISRMNSRMNSGMISRMISRMIRRMISRMSIEQCGKLLYSRPSVIFVSKATKHI